MARITNQMIVDELKRRNYNENNISDMAINHVWQELREQTGHAIKMTGEGLGEVPAAVLSEARCDKVYDLFCEAG